MKACENCKNALWQSGFFWNDGSLESQIDQKAKSLEEDMKEYNTNYRLFCKIFHSFICQSGINIEKCSERIKKDEK